MPNNDGNTVCVKIEIFWHSFLHSVQFCYDIRKPKGLLLLSWSFMHILVSKVESRG